MKSRKQRVRTAPDELGEGERLVVGLQPVREAVRVHGQRLGVVLLQRAGPNPKRLDALARFASDNGVERVERVERARLDRLACGVAHQGAAAVAPALALRTATELLSDPALVGVGLDGIEDPQNFGAIIRSAVALANAWVLWPEASSAPLSLATFRASAGAVEAARLCRVRSLADTLGEARDRGIQVVGLDAQQKQSLSSLDLTPPTLFVVGGEHRGLRRAVRHACTQLATLTPERRLDSLNASVSVALALYETEKQRKYK